MKDYLQRQIWILSELYSHPEGRTYKELEERWERSSQNSLCTPLRKRTFADCIRSIETTFGIIISCNARDSYRYRIVQRDWIQKDRIKEWLISAFAVNTLLQDSRELADRVIYEDIPSGNCYLLQMLEAMRGNHVLRFWYRDFFDAESREILLQPWLVRVFKRRWYVVGAMENSSEDEESVGTTARRDIHRYALDRIDRIETTEKTFRMPPEFSAAEYFSESFGIIVDKEDYNVETIRLKVYNTNHRREYLRSLPLHHTQQEIEKHGQYSVFEMKLAPTYDFLQELLSMGDEVEVLSPDYVREEMKWRVREMMKNYQIIADR